jgi:hypothetical protein
MIGSATGTRLLRLGAALPLAVLRPAADAAERAAQGAVERVLVSAFMEQAVDRALSGPLVETVSRDVVRYSVIERAVQPLAEAGLAEEIAVRILEGPELERVVARALDSAATERLVARVIESRAVDEAVARLLESDDLWLLVDQIARSPAVTEAIGQQGVSFADQVAGSVRGRSRAADDRVERVARRFLRRPRAPAAGPEVP